MSAIGARITALGHVLPPAPTFPPDVKLPFSVVRIVGDRAIVSGHGPQGLDGGLAVTGTVGADLSVEQGYDAARLVALSMLGSLERELVSLDRIRSWVRVFGMVRCKADFEDHPAVINGFSDLIIAVFGDAIGQHSRSAVGVSALPLGMPIEVEAELLI